MSIIKSSILIIFLFLSYIPSFGKTFTLDEAISIAIKSSPILSAAKERVKGAKFERKSIRGEFLPKFFLDYSYTNYDDEPSFKFLGRSFPLTKRDDYKLGMGFEQPIFTGFALSSRYSIAKFEAESRSFEEQRIILDIILEVKIAYFKLLETYKFLDVTNEAVKLLQAHEEDAEEFFNVGIIPRNDLLKSQVQLANALQDQIRAKNAVEIAKSVLNKILRFDINYPMEIVDVLEYKPINIKLNEALNLAIKYRPEIKEINKRIEQGKEGIKLAKSDYYPHLFLTGRYNREGDDPGVSGNNITNRDVTTIMLMARWNLWEWGKTKYKVDKNKAVLQETKEMKREIRDRIYLEVKEAYLNLKEAEKNISVAKKSVEQAEENYRITDLQYKEQVTTSTEVLDAQVLLTQARTNYFKALYEYNIAKAKLVRAIGKEI
jgi:outer membrane protein TolC